MDELLTTREVAAELQVSESSVKRWCDQGLIHTQRTAGGHRRIPRSCLDQFLRLGAAQGCNPINENPISSGQAAAARAIAGAQGRTAVPAARVAESAEMYRAAPSRDEFIKRFQHGLLAGDEAVCQQVIEQWLLHFPALAKFGDVLVAGAMDNIGRLWESGQVEVFQERRSCEICARMIHQLRYRIPDPGRGAPRAIGGTLGGDHYALASQLVELILREAGWNATSFGDNLPYESLIAAVRQERPRLLWLSISHIADPDHFVETYNRFYAQLPSDLLVAVGGRALTDDLRPRIRYTAHCDNLEQLFALAKVISGVR